MPRSQPFDKCGSQLDAFIDLLNDLILETGVKPDSIFRKQSLDLPGYFRPAKKWDILVVDEGNLIAAIELKSQVGPSFGNNFNNRTEEAIGSAKDLWTAYREGAFKESPKPWLGYFMLLEHATASTTPVKVTESHFPVFNEFKLSSYMDRYEIFCRKLVRERLYDAACFVTSEKAAGEKGQYNEPSKENSFSRFASSLIGSLAAYQNIRL